MPEAFAVLFVLVVVVASYVGAKVTTANPAHRGAQAELLRLRQQRAWLEDRLRQAWREDWDQPMRTRIADEIEETEAQLARILADRKQAA